MTKNIRDLITEWSKDQHRKEHIEDARIWLAMLMNDKKLNELLALFESGGAYEVLNTYLKLHEGKIGAHWLWCVIERITHGEREEQVLADYRYYRGVE